MCKVINLFGGPGVGKSTTAAELFARMKKLEKKVELVTEYAKELTYEERNNVLQEDQLYVFAKQQRRMKRLHKHVDYIVTDSPLFLSIVYGAIFNTNTIPFGDLVLEKHNNYENINIFIERDLEQHPYQEYGRNQNEEESKNIDEKILTILNAHEIEYHVVKYNKQNMVDNIQCIIEEIECHTPTS